MVQYISILWCRLFYCWSFWRKLRKSV